MYSWVAAKLEARFAPRTGRTKEPAMFVVVVILTLLVVFGLYQLLRRRTAH